jgi:hypothetical protein
VLRHSTHSYFAVAATRRVRRGGARGGALVEFALVAPLLILLLLGTVDFGIVLLNLNSARQGTREGARQAVVGYFGSSTTCSLNGSGIADSTERLMCLTKNRIGLDAASTRVRVFFPDANEVGKSLVVCSEYPMTSTSGALAPVINGHTIKTKVEMRIEKADTSLIAGEETPLNGEDWLWCA